MHSDFNVDNRKKLLEEKSPELPIRGLTPLSEAVKKSNWDIVESLLYSKPEMDIGTYVVILSKKPELISKLQACDVSLLSLDDEHDNICSQPFVMQAFAAKFVNNPIAVQSKGSKQSTWLTNLAERGDTESLQVLLEMKPFQALINQPGGDVSLTPLQWAFDNWESMKVLLDYKPEMDIGTYVMILSKKPELISKVQPCDVSFSLLSLNFERYDIYSQPFVMQAFAKRFVNNPTAVQSKGSKQSTWLTNLAERDDAESLQVLLEMKPFQALIDQPGGDPLLTPLQWAVANRHLKSVKVLLDYEVQEVKKAVETLGAVIKSDEESKKLKAVIAESRLVHEELKAEMPYLIDKNFDKTKISQLGQLLLLFLENGKTSADKINVTDYILNCPDFNLKFKLLTIIFSEESRNPLRRFYYQPTWIVAPSIHRKDSNLWKIHQAYQKMLSSKRVTTGGRVGTFATLKLPLKVDTTSESSLNRELDCGL